MSDWYEGPRPPHLSLPGPFVDAAEPTDEVRRLVREVLAERPGRRGKPSRIKSDLRRFHGLDVDVEQIQGALEEMRAAE